MGLYQLLYQSRSLVPFDTPELLELLAQSRATNLRLGITGLLLYTPDGRFMQLLEGHRETVRSLYFNRIAFDPRHFDCHVLSEGPCRERAFASWSMGFRMAQAPDMRTLLGYVPPNALGLLIPRPHTRPELLELLLQFVAKSETEPWREQPG